MVDDNDDDNFIHERFLAAAGWSQDVQAFGGADELLAELADMNPIPDVMFIDLNMPAMNGFELLDELAKTDFDLASTRVVVLTSSIHPDDRRRADESPLVTAYVQKPLNLQALAQLADVF